MEEKYCSNCCKKINAATFFLHERMCSQNVKKCPKCNKPIIIEDLEDHIQEEHTEVECEYCKKKFSQGEIDKHKNKCDYKMVPCYFCEMDIILRDLKEHQKACGAITEPCSKCNRYIQRKDMNKHLLDGCPPPKNDRRSVDVMRNDIRLSSGKKNNNVINDIYNNYIPININDYIPDELFFEEDNKKVDIKMHNNINKPNLQIRPPSGKKILNEAAKKNGANLSNNNINNNNKINNINNNYIINNKEKKETKNKPPNINNNINNNKINHINNTKNPQIKKPERKEAEKAKTNIINVPKKTDYFNKQNNYNKQAVMIKPPEKNIKPNNINYNMNNSRYNNRDTNKKLSSKPNFNITKGSMKFSKDKEKENDEEFRRTRDKLTFKEAKNISNKNMNNKNTNNNNFNKNNNTKGNRVINDEDYLANFNFGDVVDDEQLMQEAIEQSLKDQKKKK